ncbi:unnamed protein product [Mytilus coruscus]|uniref:Peptidase A2 domain-containing protein n=1 Tax=Mytilus coruscus TaxID=42192 RepID=A0A6J8DZN3_MYTCO|nr:unnamed protein product [Mytilus coruscus]
MDLESENYCIDIVFGECEYEVIIAKLLDLPTVQPFDCNEEQSSLSQRWTKWKKSFEYYMTASGISEGAQKEHYLDSGATCNIINSEIMSKLKKCGVNKIPIEKQLFAYGAINPLMINSRIRSDITCEESRKCVKADFMVIDGNHTPLLGRSTASELGILLIGPSVNMINTKGKLKDYQLKIYIDKSVKPIAQPTRRYTFNIRKSVEEKLCKLEEMDIIERVEGPTEWVSP